MICWIEEYCMGKYKNIPRAIAVGVCVEGRGLSVNQLSANEECVDK